MRLTPGQMTALMGNLNQDRVATRRGSGGAGALSYLEAWDVKASLIKVFGFTGFSAEVVDQQIVHKEKATDGRGNWTVAAMVTVRLTIHDPEGIRDAVYTETAASSQTNPQIGEAMDFAVKTAESDALKRAAIYLGTQFGLSLYDNGSRRDVVKKVFAPGQRDEEWRGTPTPEQQEQRTKGEAQIAAATRAANQ